MLGEKHDLIHELPEYKDRIHELKLESNHFAKLFAKYHEIDHEIKRIEEGIETPADEYVETLKKDRLHLKDELLNIIKTA
ncbi:MAG: YdcH family protein [Gammaproteobacteria bacterium]|nr:YdcH family protein [Gammaproteobacteria bacterium]